MPTGLGYEDAQGQWRYGELDDAGGLQSDLLEFGQSRVSAGFAADRVRMDDIESDVDDLNAARQIGATTVPASAAASMKTVAVTFDTPFSTIPEVIPSSWIAGSGNVYGAQAESITTTGFVLRVSNTSGGTFTSTIGPFRWIAIRG